MKCATGNRNFYGATIIFDGGDTFRGLGSFLFTFLGTGIGLGNEASWSFEGVAFGLFNDWFFGDIRFIFLLGGFEYSWPGSRTRSRPLRYQVFNGRPAHGSQIGSGTRVFCRGALGGSDVVFVVDL